MAERKGRKSAAQTPAPKSDRIKGSKINKAGSAASKKSAASIELSDSIVQTLKEKAEKFNSLHNSSVSVNTLKAVFRRGAGAFSTSHRPNISRNQWAFARVNKFLEKKAGHAVKKAYVQDDDLLADGGFLGQQVVCHNCGWTWNTDDSEDYDKYVCHKCGFDNTLFYSSDIMGNNDKIEKWYRKYNSDDPFYYDKQAKNKYGSGIYFSNQPNSRFNGDKEIEVFVDYKNPKIYQKTKTIPNINFIKDWRKNYGEDEMNKFVDKLFNSGYDAIIVKHGDNFGDELIIRDESLINIKDIKYKDGGPTFNDKELLAKYKRGESIGFTGISHLKAKGLIPRADGTKRKSEKYMENGGLLKSLEIGAENLNKNGIVLSDYDNKIIVIAYNSGNQERNASLYNKALIYKSIRPIRQANEIIERLDNNEFENFDERKIDEYKKSNQLIILNQNEVLYDSENQDLTFKKGGTINKNFNIKTMELTKSLTISDIDHKYPDVPHEFINKQVVMGIKTEMEHTNDPEVAKKIALDHLNESIHYYEELEKMEKRLEMREVDEHYDDLKVNYADGGEIDEIFHFTTPTKAKSKLTYIQQVLVRTSAFKNWFGDWEKAANRFLADGKENFEKHYKDVSKVLEPTTLEPRVVYHGTMTDNEFFSFDVTREKGVGRPYAYFAYNKEYAEHFTKVRQREAEDAKPFLYEVFLDVKHPFIAQGHDYMDKNNNADGWIRTITGTIIYDRYKTIQRDDLAKAVESTIENQIGRYVKSVYPSDVKDKFWKLMAADSNKQFKFFLLAYDFDGVFYSEEFARDYDVNNPAQFTLAITVFDAHQIKLADARNTQFDPFTTDIRFEEGGKTTEILDEKNLKTENMNKLQSMHEMMEKGGKVKGDNKLSNDGKNGGFFVGKSHAEGGIKVKNVDTDQIMEVECNEVIINKRSVADTTKREFEGEMLTNREILSKINESGGGVKFADGGEVKYNCGCSKKSYNFGGEILDESVIIKRMNILGDPIIESKNYLSNLMNNIYG